MRTLVLKSDRGTFENMYITHMQSLNTVTCSYYISCNELIRYLSIIHIQKLELPFSSLWYGSWKYKLKEFDRVILFDRNYNWNIIEFIRKKNPSCKIIIWYWNPLASTKRIPEVYRDFCEEWSFNIEDCNKFGLNYNRQFSFKEMYQNREMTNVWDFYFVGSDKGRAEKLSTLKETAEAIGYKVNFIIIKDKTSRLPNEIYSKPISYTLNLEYLTKTSAIVEMVQEGQSGLTVRCVEAIFMQKKIITNNTDILKYDFYNSSNIFILEGPEINAEELQTFMEKPFVSIDEQIINNYDFENWLLNFGGNKG